MILKIKFCYKPKKTLKFNRTQNYQTTNDFDQTHLVLPVVPESKLSFPLAVKIYLKNSHMQRNPPPCGKIRKRVEGEKTYKRFKFKQWPLFFFFLWTKNFDIGQTDDLFCLMPFKTTFPFYVNSFQLKNQSQYISLKGVLWLVKSNFINSKNVKSILKEGEQLWLIHWVLISNSLSPTLLVGNEGYTSLSRVSYCNSNEASKIWPSIFLTLSFPPPVLYGHQIDRSGAMSKVFKHKTLF